MLGHSTEQYGRMPAAVGRRPDWKFARVGVSQLRRDVGGRLGLGCVSPWSAPGGRAGPRPHRPVVAAWGGAAIMADGIQRADVGRGIELAYERFGDASDPPLLLVMGLATQMLGWPDEFCAQLAGRELFVVRFDNRDIGLSTHLDHAPPPNLPAALMGDTSSAAYTLADMARDAAGLLDRLGVQSAHVVGASMGGMIAQTLAI